MPSEPSLTDPGFLAVLEQQRRLTVGDYHRMVAADVFDEDDHVELLEGVILEMSPQNITEQPGQMPGISAGGWSHPGCFPEDVTASATLPANK